MCLSVRVLVCGGTFALPSNYRQGSTDTEGSGQRMQRRCIGEGSLRLTRDRYPDGYRRNKSSAPRVDAQNWVTKRHGSISRSLRNCCHSATCRTEKTANAATTPTSPRTEK